MISTAGGITVVGEEAHGESLETVSSSTTPGRADVPIGRSVGGYEDRAGGVVHVGVKTRHGQYPTQLNCYFGCQGPITLSI